MDSLKVVTYNIHKGLSASSSKLVLDKIQSLLQRLDADIVFLQEVQGAHTKRQAKFDDWPELSQAEFLAQDRWPHYTYGQTLTHEQGHHGNAILSKHPFEQTDNIDISTSRFSTRGLLYSRIQRERPIHLLCTHLGLLGKERRQQFDVLNDFIQNTIPADEPILLAGDFNDWRSSALELLRESTGLKEVFQEQTGKYAKSYPAEFPLLRVDRIYYRGLMPHHCEVVQSKRISDHLPLLAEFDIQKIK